MDSVILEEVRNRMRQHPKKINQFSRKRMRKPAIRRAVSKLSGRRKRRKNRKAARKARKAALIKRR